MKTKLIILSAILLVGCSARKVNKSNVTETTKTEAQTQTVDSSKTVTTADTNIKVVDCTDTDEVVIQPIDNSKEMVVNGKKYFNSVLKHKKVKNNVTTNQTTKVAQIEQKAVKTEHKVSSESKRVEVVKNTERSGFNWWWLLLLLIPLAWYYFKNKWYV